MYVNLDGIKEIFIKSTGTLFKGNCCVFNVRG